MSMGASLSRRPPATSACAADPTRDRILVVHEHYRERGGEDEVFDAEMALLESFGHPVHRFTRHNDTVDEGSPLKLACDTVWNRSVYRELRDLVRATRPAIVHFHNTLPLVSPAGYYAATRGGAAVVQSLHNYRIACVNGLLYRDGEVCERCLGRAVPWSGVRFACYRGNRGASMAVAAMLGAHRAAGTWTHQVDAYIAMTPFAREKVLEAGLPADRVWVKPNFVRPDPGPGPGDGGFALFVGRLSAEKGIATLLSALEHAPPALPIQVAGDGPLRPELEDVARRVPGVRILGRRPLSEVYELLGRATVALCPSECYESFCRVLAESFAKGTPVLATDIGAPGDIVEHGRTGRLFRSGSGPDLSRELAWIARHPEEVSRMRDAARAEFEARYTAAANYRCLRRIYAAALLHRNRRGAT